MGAWGEKAFENDAALDWFGELETEGVSVLRETLARVAGTGAATYLDVDDGSAGIAAAEIVAAALDGAPRGLPKRVVAWLRRSGSVITPADADEARLAVERVLAGKSELRSLWDDAGADSEWHAATNDLLTRLGGDPGALSTRPGGDTGYDEATADRYRTVLFAFLRARGLEPTAAQKARILDSRDLVELELWLRRAASEPSVDAVLR